MAVGQAGRLLQLVNRLRRVAPSAARVTSSATRGASGAAKVTSGATKATQTANTATKAAAGYNPLQAAFAPFKGVGQLATSKPAQTLYAAGGLVGLGTAGTVAVENKLNNNSITSLSNRAKGEVANWDTRTGGLEKSDWGDSLLNLLTGTDPQKLLEATRTERNTQFNELEGMQSALEKLNSGVLKDGFTLGNSVKVGKDGRLVLSDTMSAKDGSLRVASELARLEKYQALKAKGVTGLTGSDSIAQMEATAEAWRKAQPTSIESQYLAQQQRQNRLDQERLAQQTYQNKLADYQFTLSQARMDHQEKQAAADRQQTLQFKLMDRQDARADRAEREAVRDRQDRRAAIASMTKGLAQLGYAFAM